MLLGNQNSSFQAWTRKRKKLKQMDWVEIEANLGETFRKIKEVQWKRVTHTGINWCEKLVHASHPV